MRGYRLTVEALGFDIAIWYTPAIEATRIDPPEPAEWEFIEASSGFAVVPTIEALAALLSEDEPVTVEDIEDAIDEALKEGNHR